MNTCSSVHTKANTGTATPGDNNMIMKVALATAAAAALCAPAMTPAAATSGPAVGNVAYSVPASFGDFAVPTHKNKKKCNGAINVCGNTVQAPVQACNNNVLNNIGLGLLGGRGSAKGGNNNGKCSQKTSSDN
jgi:hypothetical protein